jgi:hypothetical protein
MRRLVLLCLLVVGPTNFVFAETPEVLMDRYANHILKEEYSQIPGLFAAESREAIKKVIDKALKAEFKKGRSRLQDTLVGKRIKVREIKSIPADTYIARLIADLMSSIQSQSYSFDRYILLGRVDESDDLAHVLIRTFVKGEKAGFDNVQIYSFRRTKDSWGMLTPETLKQMLLLIESGSMR